METENVPEDQAHKKGRHRKKQLYNSILELMEFYFSDSNLSKDRFLSNLLKTDPYVDLTIFLKFNKLRKLTTSLEEVTKAISKSELIELSEDKTKVCRKTPIRVKENADECTVYVERLKSDATHDWLKTIFSEFGKVVYVSIPKYKHNGMIKGFAFVEFDDEESAKAALQYFESVDCKIPSCMEPQKLCSIATYEKETNTSINKNKEDPDLKTNNEGNSNKNEIEGVKKKRKLSDNNSDDAETEMVGEQNGTEIEESKAIKKKRKYSNLDTSESEQQDELHSKIDKTMKIEKQTETVERVQIESKHSKAETSESIQPEGERTQIKRKRGETEGCESVQWEESKGTEKKKVKIQDAIEVIEDTHQEPMSEGEGEEKRKKKHKKSHRKKINLKEIGLQILSKKEWKKMRNRYLDMQKKTMKQLKMHLNRQRFANRYESKKHNEKQQVEMEDVQNNEDKPLLGYVQGTIVKVALSEPCESNKKLKTEVKAYSPAIKYVDIPREIGSEEIYVRFSDNKNALQFCASNFNKGKLSILEGDEEKEYWGRIEAAKQAKEKRTAGKQRGRDKLLKKAERQAAKHIRFDANDSE